MTDLKDTELDERSAPELKAFDPFALPSAPRPPVLDEARLDAIGARHGFDTAAAAPATPKGTVKANTHARPKAMRPKPTPTPTPKPKPKPPAPEVRRMRTRTAVPKAQFNQRVPVAVANGFYDYQRDTGLPMGTVLERAFDALMAAEAKRK